MNCLVRHPSIGSVWLVDATIHGERVEGKVWDNSQAGSSYYPDDYRGEYEVMNFPIQCIAKSDEPKGEWTSDGKDWDPAKTEQIFPPVKGGE